MKLTPARCFLIAGALMLISTGCGASPAASENTSETVLSTPTPEESLFAIKKDGSKHELPNHYAVDTCKRTSDAERRLLCFALVKELDIENEALFDEFQPVIRGFDLNGDGRDETVVWVPGEIGGTSGYPIVVLSRSRKGYVVKLREDAWTPIIALKTRTGGWRDIAVQIAGGGVEPHFEILRFRGNGYKFDRRQKNRPSGDMLIGDDMKRSVFGPMPSG